MNVKERLKNLEIDPLLKISLEETIAKQFQRKSKIKMFISQNINLILKEVYEPLGLWKQNPDEIRTDFGVILFGKWSALNQADTNYTGHCMIFNRCNKYLLKLYRKKGIESIFLEGELFSCKSQIVFLEEDSEEQVIEKLKKIFKIVRHKKNEIFLYTSDFAKELIELYNKTMELGDSAQKFYETHIYDLFDDLISYKSTKGRGDLDDRKEGVDIWKTHKDRKSTDQVKSCCQIFENEEYYLIDVAISDKSKCDYFVFVCVDKRINIFKNDKSKIIFYRDGIKIPKQLLYIQKFYNE